MRCSISRCFICSYAEAIRCCGCQPRYLVRGCTVAVYLCHLHPFSALILFQLVACRSGIPVPRKRYRVIRACGANNVAYICRGSQRIIFGISAVSGNISRCFVCSYAEAIHCCGCQPRYLVRGCTVAVYLCHLHPFSTLILFQLVACRSGIPVPRKRYRACCSCGTSEIADIRRKRFNTCIGV